MAVYEARRMFGSRASDFQERIDYSRLRKERLEKMRRAMKEHELEVLLCFRQDNIRYITGHNPNPFKRAHMLNYAILPKDGDPVLFETIGVDMDCTMRFAPSRIIKAPSMTASSTSPAVAL